MSINIQYEVKLICLSFFTGAGLMLIYDILRAVRIIIPHHPIWTGVEDMIYWIYASISTFLLLYGQNDGSLRGYVIAGVFAGMIIYNGLISRFFLKLLKKIVKYIKMKLCKRFRRRTKKELSR